MKKKDIICIIQARTESTRLPGKILLPGYDRPLLLHLVERLKKSRLIKKIIVATTKNITDEIIINLCKKNMIEVFKGDALDLLDRYYKCAKKYKSKNIIRITSDCPLMDHRIIDQIIKLDNPAAYIRFIILISEATEDIKVPSPINPFEISSIIVTESSKPISVYR